MSDEGCVGIIAVLIALIVVFFGTWGMVSLVASISHELYGLKDYGFQYYLYWICTPPVLFSMIVGVFWMVTDYKIKF